MDGCGHDFKATFTQITVDIKIIKIFQRMQSAIYSDQCSLYVLSLSSQVH